MKAPDKIYLPVVTRMLTKKEEIDYEWSSAPKNFANRNIAYIRKDALLEWARNWEKIGVSEDFAYAIETLIKHINSL